MGAFTIFTTKKHRAKPQTETVASYYESLARRVGYAKYLTLFALVVFIVFGFTFFGSDLSADNFRYMLKFMSVDVDSVIRDGETINYDAEQGAIALLAGGNLAIADTNGLKIFDMTGERYLKDTEYYGDPMCVSNGSNVILCDRGGGRLGVYSVYTKIYSDTFAYPVLDLCASGSGSYAVLTAAKGYRSGIEIYDGNFRIIRYYYFADRYASGIGISADGKKAAICTLSNSADGAFLGGLHILDVADADSMVSFEFPDEIPWKVWFRSDGSYLLLTNKAVRIYSRSDELVESIGFGDLTPKGYCFTDDYIALSLSTAGLSNATTVRFYSSDGSFIGGQSYHNDVSALDIAGGYAYIYSVGSLHTVDIKSGETVKSEVVGLTYISALYDGGENRIIFIYQNKAVFYGNDTYVTANKNGGN